MYWISSSQRTCGAPTSAKGTLWRKAPWSPLLRHIHHRRIILMCLLTSPPLSHCWWASSSPLSQVWTAKNQLCYKSNLKIEDMNLNIVLPAIVLWKCIIGWKNKVGVKLISAYGAAAVSGSTASCVECVGFLFTQYIELKLNSVQFCLILTF